MNLDLLYEKVSCVIPRIEWNAFAPIIQEIHEIKKERNAVILAHNYMTPEIFHCVADIVGDSLHLAREATKTDAYIIVQCGVRFMAETSKILNPQKTVLLPSLSAGCSLAASITASDVRKLKEKYPSVPVVSYVNTYADVKAESDICCTSANAVEVVESLGSDRVIFLPDEYLGRWVAKQTKVKIILWNGRCEVHERFTVKELRSYREMNEGVKIIAHPECPPDVLEEADFTGSTSKMNKWVIENQPEKVLMLTECSMSDNVQVENPNVTFVRPCNLCPHMKSITLEGIRDSLKKLQYKITIPEDISNRARLAVQKMLDIKR